MGNIQVTYKNAAISDIDTISRLMHEYYDYEGIQFDEPNARKRLHELITKPKLGKIWLIKINDNVEGYIVIAYGFGLEHGRNATIDEFYIRENFRGHGIGQKTIHFIENELRPTEIASIHTEVERKNHKAQEFWQSIGFQKYDRFPMAKITKSV
jgi:GNAT superfamily N-acetyltransferase